MQQISSSSNKTIKWVKKLSCDQKQRKIEKFVVGETKKVFCTLCEIKKQKFIKIFVTKKFFENNQVLLKKFTNILIILNDYLFKKISNLKSPDGIIFVAPLEITKLNFKKDGNYFAVVDLQNPNNLGAIIRSIFAFGIDGLFLIGNCVDIFHPEVIRASMGYVFQIPLMFFKEFYSFLKFGKNNKINLLALANKKNALALNKYKIKTNNCFLLGNEGNGLKKEMINQCHQTLKIEIENVESLNVIAVASIISYYLKHENNKN